jgi:hypothetical protein
MSDAILNIENVTMRFGGLTAVREVSMAVPRGSISGRRNKTLSGTGGEPEGDHPLKPNQGNNISARNPSSNRNEYNGSNSL